MKNHACQQVKSKRHLLRRVVLGVYKEAYVLDFLGAAQRRWHRSDRDFDQSRRQKYRSSLVLAIESTVILILTWCIVGFSGKASDITQIPLKTWPYILGAGVVTTCAYFGYFRALSMADASRVAPLDRLSLVFTVILGVFLLREKVTPLAIAGVALMAAGALLVAVAPSK